MQDKVQSRTQLARI